MKRKTLLAFSTLLITGFLGFQMCLASSPGFSIKAQPSTADDIELSNVPYFDLIQSTFELTSEEQALLTQNKFIVLNRLGTDDVIDSFSFYWEEDLPIFITTDMMLHIWHLMFSEILKGFEQEVIFPLLQAMIAEMYTVYQRSVEFTNMDTVDTDLLLYYSVAAELANVNLTVPSSIENQRNDILDAIAEEIPITVALTRFQGTALSRFIDDYTQFKPRGHYTETETLQKYFRLFKWLARQPFFYNTYSGSDILNRTPLQMVDSSFRMVWCMKNAAFEWENYTLNALDSWIRIDNFLDILIGRSYSISPLDIHNYCSQYSDSSNWNYATFNDDDINAIQAAILSDVQIPTPNYCYPLAHFLQDPTPDPKSFYFIGERMTLDSEVMENLVGGQKPFVTGLDLAATCFSSGRARELAGESVAQLISSQRNFIEDAYNNSSEKTETVNWRLQATYQELVKPFPTINGESTDFVPDFMTGGPWYDEKLTTVLGSYAQLKHDTILYSKQAMGFITCSTPEGYVEPYPDFFHKLSLLADDLHAAIQPLSYFNSMYANHHNRTLNFFQNCTQTLEEIGRKELQEETLLESEKQFIQETYQEIRVGCGDLLARGWLPAMLGLINPDFNDVSSVSNSRSSLIADIFTDPNSQLTVEIATGVLEHLIAIVPGWEGESIVTVGPVFSYYEFLTSMIHRMTDEEWRGVLFNDPTNYIQWDWNDSNLQRGPWAASYMVTTEKTSTLLNPEIAFNIPSWMVGESAPYFHPGYPNFELSTYGDYSADIPQEHPWIPLGVASGEPALYLYDPEWDLNLIYDPPQDQDLPKDQINGYGGFFLLAGALVGLCILKRKSSR